MAIGSTPAPGVYGCDTRSVLSSGLGGLLEYPSAAVETVGGDAVAQVCLTRLRITRQCGLRKPIVRAVHAATRGGFAAFLNSHGSAPESNSATLAFQQVPEVPERPMSLATRRVSLGHRGHARAALAVLVQRHDRQHQQQLLREELAEADAAPGSQHRLALEGHAGGLRLRRNQCDAAFCRERPLQR